MAYTIDTYSNSRSWKIEDGTIDQTTDLKLVGKNYAGYGEIQNENFVFLLENFAGQTEPPRKTAGQIWFDTGNSKLKFYDGTKWRTTGGAEVSSSIPTGLKQGDFWWDTANEQLYTYNGGDFVLIGPQSAGSGQTQIVSRSVRDTTGSLRNVITGVVDDTVVFTVSGTEFLLDSADTDSNIVGFDRIRQGLTLTNTINSTGGVTSGGYRFWGTASNAEKLGSIPASDYVQTNNAIFNGLAQFRSNSGIQIGPDGDASFRIENQTQTVIANETGNQIVFKAKDTFGTVKNPAIIQYNALIPGQDNGQLNENASIGLTDAKWPEIFAEKITGVTSYSTAMVPSNITRISDVVTSYTLSETTNAFTVAARDSEGDLTARYFKGIATEAWYADLAEKYSTSEELPAGTVVCVSTDENFEVEPAKRGSNAIGVVSTDPALMMNSGAEGQYIGLKGRLPVRIIGAVKKGDTVYVDSNGCASTEINGGCVVGVALASNPNESEKLVECVLKV